MFLGRTAAIGILAKRKKEDREKKKNGEKKRQ